MDQMIPGRSERQCECGNVVHWQPTQPTALDEVDCAQCGATHLFSWFVKMDVGLSEICNLHCNMCRRPPDPQFLKTDEVIRVMDEAASIGLTTVSFCGGEPFVHKDFLDICEHSFSLGFKVQLVTNGLRVTPKTLERLKPVDCITVSHDGLLENHNRIRGHEESFQKANRALVACCDAGITCGTNTVIQRSNVEDIYPLFEHLVDITNGRVNYIRYVPVEVTPLTADLMPTDEQMPIIRDQLKRVAKRCAELDIYFCHKRQIIDFLPLYMDKYKRNRPLGGCHIPQRFIGYTDLGFYLCWHQGNSIKAPSLLEALRHPMAQEVIDEAMKSQCVGCNALTYSWDEEWNNGIVAAYLAGSQVDDGRLLDQETTVHQLQPASK